MDASTAVTGYVASRELYIELAQRVRQLLVDLLSEYQIKAHAVESRAKTVESFSEKISRAGKSYDNPLQDVTDLAGARVILYTIDDVDRLCHLVESEFAVDDDNSVDKAKLLEPNQVGYQSVHYVVRLSAERADITEYRKFRDMRFEIQVRTALQDAWAAIDHRLQYKGTSAIPSQLRRRLFLLAGILELADGELSTLVTESQTYETSVENRLHDANLEIDIDSTSVRAFVKTSSLVDQLESTARQMGLEVPSVAVYAADVAELESELVYEVTEYCAELRIRTIRELDLLLRAFQPDAPVFFKKLAAIQPTLAPSRLSLVVYGMWFQGRGLPDEIELWKRGWSVDHIREVLAIVSEVRSDRKRRSRQ